VTEAKRAKKRADLPAQSPEGAPDGAEGQSPGADDGVGVPSSESTAPEDEGAEAVAAIKAVSTKLDADVLIYNGPIDRPADSEIIDRFLARSPRKPNLLMILVTQGGDPDAAYRIAREALRRYEHFILFISGYCKSAGTLLALGAHEIVMCDHGELGPVDIQLVKKDELGEMESTWTIMAAIDALTGKMFSAFEMFFLETKGRSRGQISVPTAARIGTDLASALISPICEQIDPLHVGEVARAMNISWKYGEILASASGNVQPGALEDLISGYPSHGFVIDREEAVTKFVNVREPSDEERALAQALGPLARRPMSDDKYFIRFL
jgi:hypothetical protein